MAQFNVRVYGIWIHEGKLLINEELIRGQKVIKLPGGGMDIGEGTIDCLKREWKEELNLDITVQEHFYTTDFYQPSAYNDTQVVSIYYYVRGEVPVAISNLVAEERTYWIDMNEVSEELFTLPIDKVVGKMLQAIYANKD